MTINYQVHDWDSLVGFGQLQQNSYQLSHKLLMNDRYRWRRDGEIIRCVNVMFIGQTGVGKSTTINRISGASLPTSDVESCTKEVFSLDYPLSEKSFFCINDFPGIGESYQADREYMQLYDEMADVSDCIVYLISADRRDFSLDIAECKKIIRRHYIDKSPNKLIIGINAIDKIEPIPRNRSWEMLSPEQEMNLKVKLKEVGEVFGLPSKNIVPFSAVNNMGIQKLSKTIFNVLWDNIYYYTHK